MCEPRPHRAALPPRPAAVHLRADVRAGRLDGDAVEAVLAAAGGHRVARRREGPARLTAREIDVLRLLARGMSSRQIAAHIDHNYAKIGTTNRASASLFAMNAGLLPDERPTIG
jgi:DNA-binding CsgD family transcriptional regulator